VSEPRKASDILLSLEEKVNTLTKIVSVYDMNTKLILDRVNKMYSYIEKLQKEMDEERLPKGGEFVAEPEIVQTSTEHLITMTENPVGVRRTARAESYAPDATQTMPATPVAVPTPIKTAKPDNDRKIPVLQRVTWIDSNGTSKDCVMAEITILNDQKELVVKTKTNAAGKWQAYLKPGIYSVGMVKTDTATKKKIEAMQESVHVADSNSTVILPTAMIKK